MNPSGQELTLLDNRNKPVKTFAISENGTFSDTLTIEKGFFVLADGAKYASLFLENGSDISIEFDSNNFNESISITGTGSEESSYLAKKIRMQESLFNGINTLYALDKDAFLKAIENDKDELNKLKTTHKVLDSVFSDSDDKDTQMMFNYFVSRYDAGHKAAKMIGTPSPKFVNYENYDGGSTSLDDLKGKYAYLDIWATWCGPCKVEIPFLKEIEKEFEGKNIAFVSISIDKKEAYDKWKQMIVERDLTGIQLIADSDWESQFLKEYGIEAIPRFILIDDKGNVVDANAPRPSNPELKKPLKQFKHLKKSGYLAALFCFLVSFDSIWFYRRWWLLKQINKSV